VLELKSLPPPRGGVMPHATLVQAQLEALAELWQFDPAGFDAAWRQWVLKTYARR
jgi:hypothetical protein